MIAKVILGLFGHISLDQSKVHDNYPGYKFMEPYMILADHNIDESDIKMYIVLEQDKLYKLYWNLIKLIQ